MGLGPLASWCTRHRRRVILLWVLVLVGVIFLGKQFGGAYSNVFSLPNVESAHALDLLQQRFPRQAGDTSQIVFRAPAGVDSPEVRARMESLFGAVSRMPSVSSVSDPYGPGGRSVSRTAPIAFATVQFDNQANDVPKADARRVVDAVRAANRPGLEVEVGGRAVENVVRAQAPPSEALGLLAAVFILLISFGSVIAMGLPIATALFGLGIGIGGLTLVARVFTVPEFTPEIAAMIGLGVGIDYALFIVTRYRQELHAGRAPDDAIRVSLDTSGRAVLFAGITVIISLLGMFLIGLSFVRGLAVGAVFAVLFVLVAALTLLPALLGFAGHTIDRLRLPGLHRDESEHRTTVWFRWSRQVQRRPWAAAIGALVVLGILAIPLLSLRLGFSDAGNDPTQLTTRRAYDLLTEGFGPGFNGPLVLAADVPPGAPPDALGRVANAVAATPGVVAVRPPIRNPAGDAAVIDLVPATSPQDGRTQHLVHELRSTILPSATRGTGVTVLVGGATATTIDMSSYLGARLPLFIGAVLLLSCLLLLVVFRSVVVPIKAAAMNILSIGAAYGLVVAIFQWGWLRAAVGIDKPGPVEAFAPMMMFAVLFGLSMDYEVFLLSRIREEYLKTGDNALAVADGLAATARVITAAAAIMVAVFLAFVLGDNRVVKLFGIGLASAIFIDATLVRMVLVPATMELLGDANWWLPRWLDRILPHLDVEGAAPPAGEDADEGPPPGAGGRRPEPELV